MTTIADLGTSDFPADHLPYGVGDHGAVVGRVGEHVIDLAVLAANRVLDIDVELVAQSSLNRLIDGGAAVWDALRGQLLALGDRSTDDPAISPAIHPIETVGLQLPIEVADYVDFYSSIEHATNLGRLFRPDSEPLLPNWRHIPIGYHGRAGTVVASGTPIVRPSGQRRPAADRPPTFGPSERLDIELELGAVLAAPDGARFDDPSDHLFGVVLVNDWSARDIQAWEYQPLGPFLGKSFATTIGHWVTPVAALERFWVDGPSRSPHPLPYLTEYPGRNLDLALTVELTPADSPHAHAISTTNSSGLYWTFAQQIQHLRSNGASVRTGDLIATGTISGNRPNSEGSLIELTHNGARPIDLDGIERQFLLDGDTVRLSGRFGGNGPSIGDCVGTIAPPTTGRWRPPTAPH